VDDTKPTAGLATKQHQFPCILYDMYHMVNGIQYRFLRWIAPRLPSTMAGGAYAGKSKLRILLPGIESEIKDKVVVQ
jgi:hypothetical protein